MNPVELAINDLVIANRILANEDVVDAYGHIAVRHPENPKRYFLSRSVAPELVTREDIIEFDFESKPAREESRQLYLERFIHGAIMEARPDVVATIHAHAESTLPFGIAKATPLRPVIHSGSFIGPQVTVWDIRDHFGDTNLLVANNDQGRSLAKALGKNNVALMSAHGFASAAKSIIEVVRLSVYLARNARVLTEALRLGGDVRYLSQGEIDARNAGYGPYSNETWRSWVYWATKAGVGNMVHKPEGK